MDELERWLASQGLDRLAPVLRASDVDLELLAELTEADLEKLGLSLGLRKKLLKAAASLPPPPVSSSASSAASASGPGATAAWAERRHLTVMFYDMVGSTALSERHDPEDVREAIAAFHRGIHQAIARFGGFIARVMGDGALVYFGYPNAHEHDAERAVRASLAVIESMAGLTLPNGQAAQVRIGIATGLVVVGNIVGSGKTAEQEVTGETPNLAARLQAIAEPNGIVISASTRRLLGNLFECRDLGAVMARGFAGSVQAWQVLRESAAESRFEALRAAALTPLVGREQELEWLLHCWRKAKDGAGQVVLLAGEPGIGKSRIIRTLRERLGSEPHICLSYYGSPYHRDSALHPFIDHLERAAGFARNDPAERRLTKLEALLAQSSKDVTAVMPLFAALLSIPTGQGYPPIAMTPQRRKDETLQALVAQLAGLAARQPVLVLLEDAHWIDPTSIELLGLTVDRLQTLPVLMVITFRPEFIPPWTGRPHASALSLDRLSPRQVAAMVDRLTDGKALPSDILDQIVAKTDGVPLFVEESTKTVLESGLLSDLGDHYEIAGSLSPLAIPATLQDSLMARLDRLAPVKEVAQIGAAIGREFSHALLAAVAPMRERELHGALERLVESGLVLRKDAPGQPQIYAFKHALVQDAAYQSLLRSTRQSLHARIVGVLEGQFPETQLEPELLAHHCEQAQLIEKAVGYRLRAGRRAIERSAPAEAIAHFDKALELLASLPAGPERDRQELQLQIALASTLEGAKGYAAPEIGHALARARELCERTADRSPLVPVLFMKSAFHFARAEFDTVRELGEEMRRLGGQWGDTLPEMLGSHQLGVGLLTAGEFTLSRVQFEQVLALYDPERHRPLTFLYGQNRRVTGLSWLSWALLPLGYPDHALRLVHEALAYAREVGHFNSIAFALGHSSVLHKFRRDVQAVRSRSEALISHATEQRLFFWLAGGHCLHGWALAMAGEPEAGIAELREGIAAWRATGAEYLLPCFLALQAEAHLRAGRSCDAALELLSEALSRASSTGERWFEAELHRLTGECLLDPDRAEASFSRALEIARGQSAKMWELRAASSLARLWQSQGKREQARDLLAPVYGWFSEGFDTPDLQEARSLLAEGADPSQDRSRVRRRTGGDLSPTT